jgi:hypothetical protein
MSEEGATKAPTRTGFAIVTALVAAVIFNFAYSILFGSMASHFANSAGSASDDSLLNVGIAALVAFGSNFLSCLSGAGLAKRLFPRANFARVFYAFVTLLVLGGVAIALRESVDQAGSAVVVGVYILTIAITIFGLWIYLRPGR